MSFDQQAHDWQRGRSFGFHRDGHTLLHGEAAEIIAASQALVTGILLPDIAADMRRRGIRTAAGARWTAVGVGRMLCRARNAGLAEHRGQITGIAPWPAVVPVPLWRAVLGRVHDPGLSLLAPQAAECLGAGLYRCHCGATVRVFVTAAPAPRAHYTCAVSKHWTRPAHLVDDIVTTAVSARLAEPNTRRRLRQAIRTSPADAPSLASVIADARTDAEYQIDRYLEGGLSSHELATHVADLRRRIAALRADPAATTAGAAARALAHGPALGWEHLDHQDKRGLIHLTCEVHILAANNGRRAGWTQGQSYMDPVSVAIDWKI